MVERVFQKKALKGMFVNARRLLVLSLAHSSREGFWAHVSDLENLIIFMSPKLRSQAAGYFIFLSLFLHLGGHQRICLYLPMPGKDGDSSSVDRFRWSLILISFSGFDSFLFGR